MSQYMDDSEREQAELSRKTEDSEARRNTRPHRQGN